jgi:hypothetical protein
VEIKAGHSLVSFVTSNTLGLQQPAYQRRLIWQVNRFELAKPGEFLFTPTRRTRVTSLDTIFFDESGIVSPKHHTSERTHP